MIKRISLKGSLVAAIAILGGMAIVPACSSSDKGETSNDPSNTGSIGLSLVTNGVEMDTVEFEITGPENRTGSINVESDQATIAAFIGALLAGGPYTIELTAFNDGVQVCTGTSAAFTVTAGATVGVGVGLNCGAAGNPRGNITVNGEVVSCPQITSVFVGPLQTGVSEEIDVSATASAAGASFVWTSTAGDTFEPSANAATSYVCTTAGAQTLTVTMTFGTCAPESISTQVVCVDGGVTGGSTGGSTGGVTGGTTGGVTGGTTGGVTGGTTGGDTGGMTGGDTGGTTGGMTGGTTGGTTGGMTGNACQNCQETELETNPELAEYQELCDPNANCVAVQQCAIESGCLLSSPALCFCGTDTDTCDQPTHTPTGACAEVIREGVLATYPGTPDETIFTNYLGDFGNSAGMGLLILGNATATCIGAGTCAQQ